MDYKQILNQLTIIESQLDDAMNTLPEYNANVDSQGYIDGARCDLYYLKEEVEKAVQNAGGLEMAFLEKNMIWINSVITIAPMLGFTGTVVGMIKAFEDIKMANDISPAVVAGGISQALLTTAFGLIVAMIMQVAQNFFVSMIDKLILDMEEQSIKIVEYLHSSKK